MEHQDKERTVSTKRLYLDSSTEIEAPPRMNYSLSNMERMYVRSAKIGERKRSQSLDDDGLCAIERHWNNPNRTKEKDIVDFPFGVRAGNISPHKRGRFNCDQNPLDQFSPSSRNPIQHAESLRTTRCHSEGAQNALCTTQVSPRGVDQKARLATKDDAPSRPGKSSSGQMAPQPRSSKPRSHHIAPHSSSTVKGDIEDGDPESLDTDDDLPHVINVKSVKKTHTVTPLVPKLPILPVSGHDPKKSSFAQEKAGPRPQAGIWNAFARYQDPSKTSLPKYGHRDPRPKADKSPAKIADSSNPLLGVRPAAAPKPVRSMPRVDGGPKPVNRLSTSHSNTNPPFKNPLHTKPNRHESHTNFAEPPNKRQRIETASQKPPVVIDLEESNKLQEFFAKAEPAYNLRKDDNHGGDSPSGHTAKEPGQGEQEGTGENIRLRNGSSSKPRQLSSKRFLNTPVKQTSVMRLVEDIEHIEDDDDDLEIDMPEAFIPSTELKKSSNFSIEIPVGPSSEHAISQRYQGNAHLHPPRPRQPKALRMQEEKQGRPELAAAKLGPTRKTNGSLLRNSGSSIRNLESVMAQEDKFDPDASLDELSVDYYKNRSAQEIADELVEKQKQSRKRDHESMGNVPTTHTAEVLDSGSEDEISRDDSHIKPTNFQTKKDQARKLTKYQTSYEVIYACTQQQRWLVDSAATGWYLLLDTKEDFLKLFNSAGGIVWDQSIQKVDKLRYNPSSPVIIIHSSRDMGNQDTNIVFLQLQEAYDANDLRQNLKREVSNIGSHPKEDGHLEKIMLRVRYPTDEKTKRRRVSSEVEAEDIKLIQRKIERRAERSQKPPQVNKTVAHPAKSANLRKLMKDSSEISRDQETSRHFNQTPKQANVAANEFYGSSSNSLSTSNATHITRSSTRTLRPAPSTRSYQPYRSPSPEQFTKTNPEWEKNWKGSVIYPTQGKNKATVDKQDIMRLDEGEFLNDNLIVFYLRWLEHELSEKRPDLAKRIYFHNTFFYERLTNCKDKQQINYEAVERWTAKVNLLEFDYIIVPVNEFAHWYVAIICNAPKLINPGTEAPAKPEELAEVQIPGDDVGISDHQPTPQSPKEPALKSDSDVDTKIDKLTLKDNPPEEDEQEWPNEELAQKPQAFVDQINGNTTNGFDAKHDNIVDSTLEAVSREPSPANVVSDLGPAPAREIAIDETPLKATSHNKKGKRKSTGPGPRKYDPTQPRIVTFDSLGMKHPITIRNLRKYLIAEIKTKLDKDVTPPHQFGMAAKHIPQQDNHCDCGVFLLSYIEKFVDKPDLFIASILQGEEPKVEWPKAPEMRTKIRDILFDLQAQITETASKKEKKKKVLAKSKEENPVATTSNSVSREASKSTPASPILIDADKVPLTNGTSTSSGSSRPLSSKTSQAMLSILESDPLATSTSNNTSAVSKRSQSPKLEGSKLLELENGCDNSTHADPRKLEEQSNATSGMMKKVFGKLKHAFSRSDPIEINDSQSSDRPTDLPSNHGLQHDVHETKTQPIDCDSDGFSTSDTHKKHKNQPNVSGKSPANMLNGVEQPESTHQIPGSYPRQSGIGRKRKSRELSREKDEVVDLSNDDQVDLIPVRREPALPVLPTSMEHEEDNKEMLLTSEPLDPAMSVPESSSPAKDQGRDLEFKSSGTFEISKHSPCSSKKRKPVADPDGAAQRTNPQKRRIVTREHELSATPSRSGEHLENHRSESGQPSHGTLGSSLNGFQFTGTHKHFSP